MSSLPVQFLDQSLHRVMFDAVPIPMFVVDPDVSILEYNAAAAQWLGNDRTAILRKRGGEVLHCLHAGETPRGCGGSDSCPDCVVRNSVTSAARGVPVVRRPTQMELVRQGRPVPVDVQVTTNPFQYERHSFVLLMLEGLEKVATRPAARAR